MRTDYCADKFVPIGSAECYRDCNMRMSCRTLAAYNRRKESPEEFKKLWAKMAGSKIEEKGMSSIDVNKNKKLLLV